MGGNNQSKTEPKCPSEKETERQDDERFMYQVAKRAAKQYQRETTASDSGSTSSSVDSSDHSESPNPPSPKRLKQLSTSSQSLDTSTCAQPVSEIPQHRVVQQPLIEEQFPGRLCEKDVSYLSEALASHAHKWKEIGVALGFSLNELKVVAAKPSLHIGAPTSWLIEMLTTWVQWTPETQHGKYATLQDLVKSLQSKTVGLGVVAEDIKKKFTGEQSELVMDSQCQEESLTATSCPLIPPDLETASPLEHYAYYLRLYYTRNRKPDDKWPGIEAKEYTNLAVISNEYECREDFEDMRKATIHGSIDDVLQGRKPIELADILKPNDIRGKKSAIKQILLEGAPGIGKSTMSCELCRKWGNRELFQEYSLVVMLRFRDPWVQKVMGVSDLFRFPGEPELQEKVARQIRQTQGKGLLLILEGYDEAPPTLKEPDSLFSELFKGELLPNATVLVTSRPSATQYLRQCCKGESSRRIEVLGFEKEEIKTYIESQFTETKQREKFFRYLENYPHIYSMMYVPLNAAIVTHVYQECKTTSTIVPQTMTELYTSLVRTLLLRYMKEFPEYKNIRINGFTDLPKPVYEKFLEICRLAYSGIVVEQETKIIFSDLPEGFDSLGLMQSIPELYVSEGASFSYNFLHLTVQEFLAAYHLSLLGEDQIESFLQESAETHVMVCRFLAGHSIKNVTPICKSIFKQASPVDSDQVSLDVPALLMLFELHSPHAIANMFQSKTITFQDHDMPIIFPNMYPFDYYALGYCICVSNCSWDLTLLFLHCYDMLAKALLLFNNQLPNTDDTAVGHSLTIIVFDNYVNQPPRSNYIPDSPVKMFTECMRVFPNLQKLSLCAKYENKSNTTIFRSLPESLTRLETEFDLDENEWIALRDVLSDPNRCIKHLVVKSSGAVMYSEYIMVLNIFNYDFIVESISSLVSLHLEGLQYRIGDNGVKTLAKLLENNSTMESLHLSNCDIHDEGATALADLLKRNSTLRCLHFSTNYVTIAGATALATALRSNSTIKSLDLQQNAVRNEGAAAFADSLEYYNSTLKSLNLSHNSIYDSGACALAKALQRHYSKLEELYLEKNVISKDGVAVLRTIQKAHPTLVTLDLQPQLLYHKIL